MTKSLLLIEDTPTLQMVYKSILTNAGYDVVVVSTAAEGLKHFKSEKPNIILLDLLLPDRDGLNLMKECLAIDPTAHFIVITANGSINRAVSAMRAGAYEFLVKPFNDQHFLKAIANALRDATSKSNPISKTSENIGGFIGSSEIMQSVYSKISNVSRSMATVFITGESGTGKEICAQALHDNSDREDGPFVPLNCGAIPADLLESEVFGHLKGSFTGAISDKLGAAAVANGGTLFLDEICEMDLNLQTKLLRFLQTSAIQPVGATKAHKVNVRIICATNRDPMEEVRRGRFREDLYYRLYVVPIELPPLRDRGNDVIEVAQTGLRRFSEVEGKNFERLSPQVKDLFRQYPWPGNVRQLMNVLRSVVVMNDGPILVPSMLPREILSLQSSLPPSANEAAPSCRPRGLDALLGKPLAEIERIIIEATIEKYGGSVPKASRVLDVSPSTLYRKIEAWAKKP